MKTAPTKQHTHPLPARLLRLARVPRRACSCSGRDVRVAFREEAPPERWAQRTSLRAQGLTAEIFTNRASLRVVLIAAKPGTQPRTLLRQAQRVFSLVEPLIAAGKIPEGPEFDLVQALVQHEREQTLAKLRAAP